MRNKNIVIIFFMFIVYAYVINIIYIPKNYVVSNIEDYDMFCLPGIKEELVIETSNNLDEGLNKNISNIKYEY